MPALSEQDVVDIYAKNITAKTKVLVFPHIDNLVGLRYPVRKMAEMARAKGVDYIAVDGAQAVGMIPVSLHELGVDFYATSPHKWLQAPKGTGLLYVRKEMQAMLEPMWVTWGQQRWHTSARKYEHYGTRNLATVLALGDAIDWQHKLDSSGKQQRLQKLRAYFLQKTEATPMCSWRSPRKWQQGCSLYTIELQGEKSTELSQRLYQIHGVVFRPFSGENWNTLRVSLNFYNTEAEIDRFFALARL